VACGRWEFVTLSLVKVNDDLATKFIGTELEKVIALNAPCGEGLVLASLELYTDGIAVRWISSGSRDLPPRLQLRDESGDELIPAGSGWFGAAPAVRGESLFRSNSRGRGSALRLSIEDAVFDIAI
jgi:hypothetical protein